MDLNGENSDCAVGPDQVRTVGKRPGSGEGRLQFSPRVSSTSSRLDASTVRNELIPFTGLKLRAKKAEEPLTSQEWRARISMTRSSDPLNHWQAHYRQEVLPDDGLWLREHPTMICYFASPSTDLATCGIYKKNTDRNLTSAYLRTSVHQYLYEMQTQLQDHARNAGCICCGSRFLSTSSRTGCVFYKNPNQFIFNLPWVNLPNFV